MEGNLKFIDGIIIGTVDEAVFVNGTNKTIAENNPLFECERNVDTNFIILLIANRR